ncbi:hypothetical protein [Thermus sp. NMX2.A1]|uniref:hypothetical protein n=2 Tax=Thermus TaxID=270 RepID=UPI0003DC7129|nr:hypothetical protein [Thermus sp. NMX2.A1]ETN89252.1 hypothetical protein TNMX_02715 [Thermus sp. NMX2.A1]
MEGRRLLRWSRVPTEEAAGAFAERALRRYMTGFRVERGWRNGVRHVVGWLWGG